MTKDGSRRSRNYGIEPVSHKLPEGTGHFLVSTHRVLARDDVAKAVVSP